MQYSTTSLLVALALLCGNAHALEITLPPETASYLPSDLPGYALVQRNCMTCHSAQYVQYQPPTSPRSYWEATVKKMAKPFGAPLAPEDMPAIVDYLVKTYGAEHVATTMPSTIPTTATAPDPGPSPGTTPRTPEAILTANNCTACHAVDKKIVGPAFKEVATKYAGQSNALERVMHSIRNGGSGQWGPVPMPANPGLSATDMQTLAHWVLAR